MSKKDTKDMNFTELKEHTEKLKKKLVKYLKKNFDRHSNGFDWVDLRDLDFGDWKVVLSGLKAEEIDNSHQEARYHIINSHQVSKSVISNNNQDAFSGINNEMQRGDYIENSNQTAKIIDNYHQTANKIDNSKQLEMRDDD